MLLFYLLLIINSYYTHTNNYLLLYIYTILYIYMLKLP
uniref:Uncharacterized protein n=1 Tax=Heterorhabditis bacteriophora TaxID=37862 RepID=A0A1I7X1G5_HETBA